MNPADPTKPPGLFLARSATLCVVVGRGTSAGHISLGSGSNGSPDRPRQLIDPGSLRPRERVLRQPFARDNWNYREQKCAVFFD